MQDNAAVIQEILNNSFVCDMVWPIRPQYDNTYDSLMRHKKSGFNLVSVTLAGDQHNVSQAVQMVASHRKQVLDRAEDFVLVESIDDIDRAERENKLAIMFHFEGTRLLERNLDMIEAYFKLGIRANLLVFNQANSSGGGSFDNVDSGLTALGKDVVREMDRVGMLLDLSHTGRQTAMQAMELYSRPCMYSHNCVQALHDNARNVTDVQIDLCAEHDGVIGISGGSMYLGDYECKSETVFQHLDYIVQRVGPRHAGIGLDVILNGPALTNWLRARPVEWPFTTDPSWPGAATVLPEQIVDLVGLMIGAGYSEDDVVNILGNNFKRLFLNLWQ